MCFMRHLVKPKVDDPTDFDMDCAKRLADKVRLHRKTQRPIYLKVWAKEFRKMQDVDRIEPDHLKRVFNWYIAHFAQPFVPEAFSGKGFRQKFDSIERAMERDKRKNPPKIIVVSEEIFTTSERVVGLGWHKGRSTITAAVKESLSNYSSFRDWLVSLKVKDDRLCRFRNYLLQTLPSNSGFVLVWFEKLHSLQQWGEWDGNLVPFAFKVTDKKFQRQGRDMAAEYSGSVHLWDRLMQEYNK